jgi:ATP-dependent RNA helicase RhlE
LTPTRELAAQVGESVATYGKHLPLRHTVVFGGVGINPQMMALRKGVDVLVACPGRLLDLYSQNAVRFDELEILVLDEADRMLDMGFIHDIRRVLKLLPQKRQNLLFSATFADEIRELATGLLNNPLSIEVAPRNSTAERIEQLVHPVDKANKPALLAHLVVKNSWERCWSSPGPSTSPTGWPNGWSAKGSRPLPFMATRARGPGPRRWPDSKAVRFASWWRRI